MPCGASSPAGFAVAPLNHSEVGELAVSASASRITTASAAAPSSDLSRRLRFASNSESGSTGCLRSQTGKTAYLSTHLAACYLRPAGQLRSYLAKSLSVDLI